MQRMKWRSKVSVATALMLGASASIASPLWCAGTLMAIYMTSDGSVEIKGTWRNEYTQICSDQGTFGGIDSVTCLSWFALAVKAQTAQVPVTVYYPDAGSYTCGNLPSYASALTPNYLLISQ